uniref:Uncharacterized protein n=1 Tax=Plectus sambesii TaxID=2011161 RepID=A0A914VBY6_9BILA
MSVSPMNLQLSPVVPPADQGQDDMDKAYDHPNQPQQPPPPPYSVNQQMATPLQQGPMLLNQPATIFVQTGNCPRCR